jgi:hypothetical protein
MAGCLTRLGLRRLHDRPGATGSGQDQKQVTRHLFGEFDPPDEN